MATMVVALPPAPHRFNSEEVTGDPAGYRSGSPTYRSIPVTGTGVLLSREAARPARMVTATPAPSAFQSRVYNRIFVLPMYRNLGSLSEDVAIDMFVWNSYLYQYAYIDVEYPKILNSIQVDFPQFTMGVDGETPYGIPPGQVEQGWATVTGTSGPSGKINFPTMQFTVNEYPPPMTVWTFTPSIDVIRGGVLFPFYPNTGEAYGEKFKWNTDIVLFDGGKEQRSALKDYPSMAIEASYSVKDDDLMLFNSLLWGWQGRDYLIPLWHLGVRAVADPAQKFAAYTGDSSIQTQCAAFSRMLDGYEIVIWLSTRRWQVVTLQYKNDGTFYDPSTLFFDPPLEFEVPKGAYIFPVRKARMEKEAKGDSPVANVTSYELRFSCLDDEVYAEEDSGILFEDAYVIDVMPNWVEPMNESAVRDIQEMRNDVGKDYYFDKSEAPSIVRNFYFWFNHITDADKFYKWLFYRRGSANSFWLPSGKADMAMVGSVPAATARTIDIKYMAAATMYAGSKAGREAVLIELRDGTKLPRRISEITYPGSGDIETVTFTTPLGKVFSSSDVRVISFMGKNRLSSDEITIEWQSDRLMIANSNMTTLIGN